MGTKSSEMKQKVEEVSQLKKTFFKAVKSGDVQAVQKLLESGCDITWKDTDEDGNKDDYSDATAIHYAAMNGHEALLTFLLDYRNNAGIDDYDDSFYTPLHYAVQGNYVGIVKILVDREANILAPGCWAGNDENMKHTPFHMATAQMERSPEIFNILGKALIGKGINIFQLPADSLGGTPLFYVKHQTVPSQVTGSASASSSSSSSSSSAGQAEQGVTWTSESSSSASLDIKERVERLQQQAISLAGAENELSLSQGIPVASGSSTTLSFSSTAPSSSLSSLAGSSSTEQEVEPAESAQFRNNP